MNTQHSKSWSHSIILANNPNNDRVELEVDNDHSLKSADVISHTHLTSIDTRLDACIGHTNNATSLGEGSNQLRTLGLGYDVANGVARCLRTDANGRLECSVDALEVTAETINLSTDTLETLIGTTNTKLDTLEATANSIQTACEIIDNAISGSEIQCDVLTMPAVVVSGTITAELSAVDNAVLDAIAVDGDNIQTKLDTLEATANAIETALSNVTTGNELQCDVISMPTITANLGAVDNAVLDDIAQKLGDIETAVQVLDNAIDGNEIQCDVLTMPTITANLGATDNAVLDDIAQKLGDIETAVQIIDNAVSGNEFQCDVLTMPTITANLGATDNAVLDDIAQKLGDIETAVQILDNAISGNEIQCDVLTMPTTTIQGTVTAELSATDNAVLDAIATDGDNIQTKLDTLETTLTAIETDQAAIEVLHTTTNALVTTMDGVLDAIKTDTQEIEEAVEVIEACVGSNKMNVNVSSSGKTTGQWFDSATIADDAFSASALNCEAYKSVRLFGKWTGSSMSGIPIMGSQTESGTYYTLHDDNHLKQQEMELGGASTHYVYAVIDNVPPWIKVYNESGAGKTMELDFVGFIN